MTRWVFSWKKRYAIYLQHNVPLSHDVGRDPTAADEGAAQHALAHFPRRVGGKGSMLLSRAAVALLPLPDQEEECHDAMYLDACSLCVVALLGKEALQKCAITLMKHRSSSFVLRSDEEEGQKLQSLLALHSMRR